jgi:hypothetical protein
LETRGLECDEVAEGGGRGAKEDGVPSCLKMNTTVFAQTLVKFQYPMRIISKVEVINLPYKLLCIWSPLSMSVHPTLMRIINMSIMISTVTELSPLVIR